jgi:hypothetical protein
MSFHQITPAHPARPCRRFFLAAAFGFLLLLPRNAAADGAPLVVSFTNATTLTNVDIYTNASPFPSTIQVPTLAGALQSVTVTLYGLTDLDTSGIEILLLGPSGQAVDLMYETSSGAATNVTLTIADAAAPFAGEGATLTNGAYQPSGVPFGPFDFPFAPIWDQFPQVTTNGLAGFIGTALNGTWGLYEVYNNIGNGPGGISGGWSLTFTLTPTNAAVTTLAASAITSTNATLNATVDPNLSATTVYFEYGPTTNYGSFSATNTLASDLVDAQPVAQAITGLPPATTNHFQAVAHNSAGTSLGGDLTFITAPSPPPPPPVLDAFLTNGDIPVLILHGTVGSNYVILLATNFLPPVTWTVLTNLILTNPVQVINPGLPASQMDFFALETAAPVVTTLAASNITATNAILNATVNPSGGPAAVYFEYGPTAAYGSFSATNILASGLDEAQAVAQAVTGLSPGTTNHFQAVAQNGLGTNFGGDLTFTTAPAPPALGISLAGGASPVLTLYGTPGFSYVIWSATNLLPAITWTQLTNLTMTNAVQVINPGLPAGPTEFFRAAQQQ